MDFNNIPDILEKYWEGETSLEEEKTLREFFSQDEVPDAYRDIQPMFRFFKKEQEAYLNGDFDERLSSKLKAADNVKPRAQSLTFYIKRAAAVAAILIGVIFFLNKNDFFIPQEDIASVDISSAEKQEAQLAYTEAKAALLLISKKLNKGANKAESGIVKIRKATDVIINK